MNFHRLRAEVDGSNSVDAMEWSKFKFFRKVPLNVMMREFIMEKQIMDKHSDPQRRNLNSFSFSVMHEVST